MQGLASDHRRALERSAEAPCIEQKARAVNVQTHSCTHPFENYPFENPGTCLAIDTDDIPP